MRRERDALETAGRACPERSRRDAGPTRVHQAGVNRMDETQVGPEKTLLPAAPHGLEEIVTTFGDIYDYIRPRAGSLIHRGRGLSCQRGASLLPAAGVGSFEEHKPDDLSQADDRDICLGIRSGAVRSCNRRLRHSADALPFASSGPGPGCPPTVGALRSI